MRAPPARHDVSPAGGPPRHSPRAIPVPDQDNTMLNRISRVMLPLLAALAALLAFGGCGGASGGGSGTATVYAFQNVFALKHPTQPQDTFHTVGALTVDSNGHAWAATSEPTGLEAWEFDSAGDVLTVFDAGPAASALGIAVTRS